MSVSIPVQPLFAANLNGMQIYWTSTTAMGVKAGQCSNSTIENTIVLAADTAFLTTQTGAGGLDQGTIAASTMYAVYAIGSSFGQADPSVTFSTDFSAPLLPFNYDMYRLLGYVLTDGSSHFLKQTMYGNGNDRTVWYDVAISELSGGTSASYAAVNIATSVPTTATTVIFNASLTPTAAGDVAAIRPTGSSATPGYVTISGAAAGVLQEESIWVPCNATPSIDYKVTGSLTLTTAGYVVSL